MKIPLQFYLFLLPNQQEINIPKKIYSHEFNQNSTGLFFIRRLIS
jgi:hypothetical protein